MIDLYFWPTGNGKKIVILLEELGLPYTIKPINIGRGDQLTPDFLRISPNGRIPAIVDDQPIGGGAPISIFESGPIMMYLAEKNGRFWPQEPRSKYDVAQWVGWQLANQGPKLGEQGHFRRAEEAGEHGDLSYALRRFDNEAHRIYGVMNLGLFNKRYLAAGQYTIADMICYPWASNWANRKIDIEEFPNVKRWLEEIGARPAVKKAMAMGPEFSRLFSKPSSYRWWPREFTVTVDFDPECNIFLIEDSDIPGLTGWAPNYVGLVDKIAATSIELLRLNRPFIKPLVSSEENLNTAVIQVRDARENHVTHKFIAGAGLQKLSAG